MRRAPEFQRRPPPIAPYCRGMDNSTAWGIGLATITLDGTTLDTWYPAPHLGEPGSDEELATSLSVLERVDDARRVRTD